MLAEFTPEEVSAALDAVASQVLDASGYRSGAVDTLDIAARLGLTVVWDNAQPGRARFVCLHNAQVARPQGSIMLRPDPRPQRVQWAVAHEIGEHHAHLVFQRLGVTAPEAPPGAREKVANFLAGRILLPRRMFQSIASSCNWDLPTPKAYFSSASNELIARRMLDFEPQIVITLVDHDRVTFRRGNLPSVAPPLLGLERRCQQAAHEAGEKAIRSDCRLRVTAWPVHEPEWKREVLRSEWLGDFADAADCE